MKTVIRQASHKDIQKINSMLRSLYKNHKALPPINETKERLSDYSFVAEFNSSPIGFIIASVETIEFMKSEIGKDAFPGEKHYLEIQDLFVLPKYRNNKIGEQLVNQALSIAKTNGIKKAMVYSGNKDYARIARFYEKTGFEMWHIFMTKDLAKKNCCLTIPGSATKRQPKGTR